MNQGAVISTKPIEDYADALSTLGPTASKAGFGLTDIATALAITAQSSRSAGQAGAGIQRLILAIAEILRILKLPDMQEKLAALGATVSAAGPAEFAAFLQAEIRKWDGVARRANIRLE